MRKLSSYLCILLSATLLLASVGCGKKNSSSNSNPTNSSGEKLTSLSICTVSAPYIQDMSTNKFTKWMEEKTNIHVDWSFIPSVQGDEKLQIILNSGKLPDVFMTGMKDTVISKYGVDQGLFVKLDDYIKNDAPNLNKAIEISNLQNVMKSMQMEDGHIYSMPRLDICQHCEQSIKMWLYDPWMKKLGLEYPKTTDDYEKVLLAFKTKDPNANNKADEIPLAGSNSISGWHTQIPKFLFNSFCYYDRDKLCFYVKDNTVKNCLTEASYKTGLEYLNKLYKQGLIYVNSFTQDKDALIKLVENPNGVTVGSCPGGATANFSQFGGERGQGFRPIAPLEGPNGYHKFPLSPSLPSNGNYIITTKCKDIKAAIKYADTMYTEEATLIIRAGGFKDDVWRYAKDGEVGFDGKPARWTALKPWNDSDPQNDSWMQLGVWNFTQLRTQQATDTKVNLWTKEGNEYMLYKKTLELYSPYALNQMCPPLKFSTDDSEQVATLQTNLTTLIDSSQFEFITGEKSLSSDWDAYVNDINKLLKPLIDLYQKAYNKQYK